jgi:hypothetical protein
VRKRILAVALAAVLLIAAIPRTRAAGIYCFTAVNDTLLPFREYTMPSYFGSTLYVPYSVFSYADVSGAYYSSDGRLTLYTDYGQRRIDFNIALGTAHDQDNTLLPKVNARSLNGTAYVPLEYVVTYFNLSFVRIINDPASVIRIKSSAARFNDDTFMTLYKDEMRSQYDDFFGNTATPTPTPSVPLPPTAPPSPGTSPTPAPPPTYESVTLYLSFYGIGEGGLDDILEVLSDFGIKACFFVTAEDILSSPDALRAICGSGHKIGLWLTEGTYSQYTDASALLFEAAKAKSLIVASPDESRVAARDAALANGLIYRDASRTYGEDVTAAAVADSLPKTDGARYELRFSCSGDNARILQGVISFAREWRYGFGRIVETSAQAN